MGPAALRIDPNDPDASADVLGKWWLDRPGRIVARERAWELGQTRFNWDVEQLAFLHQVKGALNR